MIRIQRNSCAMFCHRMARMVLEGVLHSTPVQRTKFLVERLRYCSPKVFRRNAGIGNEQIARAIQAKRPAAVGKLGSTELQCLRAYLRCKKSKECVRKTAFYRRRLLEHSGVYPDDYETFSKWGDYWVQEVLPGMTHVGVWFNFNESLIVRRYARNASVFDSYGLEPYIFPEPWSAQLAGKTVVVVSPFTESIQRQYALRDRIWRLKPRVLPDFELHTVRSPTYPHMVKPTFPGWFEALEDMKRQVGDVQFDALLVGAGAYSLPLCVYAQSLGKVGIHLGGNTQLMFGILGRRWLVPNSSIDHRHFNDSWTYPLAEETPPGSDNWEEGHHYWK